MAVQSDAHRSVVRSGLEARNQALRILIQNHQEEYESILARERVNRNLPPKPIKNSSGAYVTTEELKARLERWGPKMEKWRQELEERENAGEGGHSIFRDR